MLDEISYFPEDAEIKSGLTDRTGGPGERVAMVTGASSGIGRAIAVALSRNGIRVCALGRNAKALAETVAATQEYVPATALKIDLTADEGMDAPLRYIAQVGRVDFLIHSAGIIHQDRMENATIRDLDRQYAVNVRAPYVLTQRLLPQLIASRGQIVFVNSSAGLAARRPDVGQYASTKYALRAIADSLREEVNPKGVRVLSVYLGRTATPMQEALFQAEGRTYNPEVLLQPEDVASVIAHALTLPATAEITDLSIRPTRKP